MHKECINIRQKTLYFRKVLVYDRITVKPCNKMKSQTVQIYTLEGTLSAKGWIFIFCDVRVLSLGGTRLAPSEAERRTHISHR